MSATVVCERCAVTFAALETRERYTFTSARAALEHAVEFHGNRVVDVLLEMGRTARRDGAFWIPDERALHVALSDDARPKSLG